MWQPSALPAHLRTQVRQWLLVGVVEDTRRHACTQRPRSDAHTEAAVVLLSRATTGFLQVCTEPQRPGSEASLRKASCGREVRRMQARARCGETGFGDLCVCTSISCVHEVHRSHQRQCTDRDARLQRGTFPQCMAGRGTEVFAWLTHCSSLAASTYLPSTQEGHVGTSNLITTSPN